MNGHGLFAFVWPAIPSRKRSQTGPTWSYHQLRMVAPLVVHDRGTSSRKIGDDDWWCHLSYGSAISHDLSRLVARLYDWWYHQSFYVRKTTVQVWHIEWWETTNKCWRKIMIGWPIARLATIDRTSGRRLPRLIVRAVAGCHEWSHDRSLVTTSDRTITYQ